jgi:hypothetical protein
LHPFVAFGCGLNVDAQFQDAQFQGRSSLPPPVILDYIYGVAAYKTWNSRRATLDIHGVMERYHQEQYQDIPPLLPRTPPDDDDTFFDIFDDSDDPNDPDFVPDYLDLEGEVMAKAMDDMNLAIMLAEGVTMEEVGIRRKKKMEEEDLKVQEASRGKVTEWLETADVGGSYVGDS